MTLTPRLTNLVTTKNMASEEWFESWFDSPLYEQLYASRDDTEAAHLVDWIAGMIPPEQYPDVLDMGCGRGRHSVLLAEHGYSVTGVDLSPRAIKIAQKRAEDHKLENVRFEIGDMRSFRSAPFDLVCNLFTSFGYFEREEDNRKVIQNMSRLIRDDGFLVFDYLNAVTVQQNLVPEEDVTVGEMQCRITREVEGDTIVKTIFFNHGEEGREKRYQERVKLYGESWFRDAFDSSGLTITEVRGDYTGTRFDPDRSSRLLILARR